MRAYRNAFALFAFALVLCGCASMGNEKADTFSKQFAYATGVNKAVVEAATSSVQAGTVKPEVGEAILRQADHAHELLQAAETAYAAGDQAGANAKLATALGALQALQDFLRSQGAQT